MGVRANQNLSAALSSFPNSTLGTTETWFATFYLTSLGKKDGRKYIINIYDCLKKRKHLLKPERFLWCRVSRASATQHGCFQSGCGKHVRAWSPPLGKLQWTQEPGQAKHYTQYRCNMPESESSGRMLPVSQGPSNQFPAGVVWLLLMEPHSVSLPTAPMPGFLITDVSDLHLLVTAVPSCFSIMIQISSCHSHWLLSLLEHSSHLGLSQLGKGTLVIKNVEYCFVICGISFLAHAI